METWKDIAGFEGIYQVSDMGKVRSLDRVDSRGAKHKSRIKNPGWASKKGYAVQSLYKGGKQTMRYVHRLVAEAFIGVIPEGYVVNHKDNDTKNNWLSNLEIVTREENASHGAKQTTGKERMYAI